MNMNKQLMLYNREQQIKYLELQAMIEFMLLRLDRIKEVKLIEDYPDNHDLTIQLLPQE